MSVNTIHHLPGDRQKEIATDSKTLDLIETFTQEMASNIARTVDSKSFRTLFRV